MKSLLCCSRFDRLQEQCRKYVLHAWGLGVVAVPVKALRQSREVETCVYDRERQGRLSQRVPIEILPRGAYQPSDVRAGFPLVRETSFSHVALYGRSHVPSLLFLLQHVDVESQSSDSRIIKPKTS